MTFQTSTTQPIQPAAPEPPASPPPRREGLLVVLAVILGAVVVLAGLIGLQRLRSDGDQVAAEADRTAAESASTTTPSTVPPPSEDDQADEQSQQADEQPEALDRPAVASLPCPDQYSAEICQAADFVQQTRGKPFKEFPTIELLEDAAFDAALLDDFEQSRAELLEDEQVMKSLGLLPKDLDLFDTFRALIEVGVVGFYDPDSGRLVVRGGDFDLYGQAILVHELVHAYDDQWFDLSRDDFEHDDEEYAYLAVIEGNARRVEELWRETLDDSQMAELSRQEMTSLSPEDLERLLALPRVLLTLQISPYQDGEVFVSSLVDQGGEEAVDRRFAEPPESSEQVLHPGDSEEFLTVVEVEPPTVDGQVLSSGSLGELMTSVWLGQEAAVGWGGDSYVVWQSDGRTCLTVDYVADTELDRIELRTSAERWVLDDTELRSFGELDSVDDSKLRVTGCY